MIERRYYVVMSKPNPILPALSIRAVELFWSKVKKGAPGECWPWIASVHRTGYGNWGWRGRRFSAHVIAKFIDTGIWPAPLLTCHSCDNRSCCNPSHLFIGSESANARDALVKGRRPYASKRFTHDDVQRMRELRSVWKLSLSAIAREFNCTVGYVSDVTLGRRFASTFKHTLSHQC